MLDRKRTRDNLLMPTRRTLHSYGGAAFMLRDILRARQYQHMSTQGKCLSNQHHTARMVVTQLCAIGMPICSTNNTAGFVAYRRTRTGSRYTSSSQVRRKKTGTVHESPLKKKTKSYLIYARACLLKIVVVTVVLHSFLKTTSMWLRVEGIPGPKCGDETQHRVASGAQYRHV